MAPEREMHEQAGSNFPPSSPRSPCCETHAAPSAEPSDSPESQTHTQTCTLLTGTVHQLNVISDLPCRVT